MATKKTETAAEGPIDLSGFDDMVQRQEEGILVPIKGPDGRSSLGFSIKVAGPDSEKAQEALDAIQAELVEQASLESASARDIAQRRLRYFAKVTLDFVPDKRTDGTVPDVAIKLDGAPLPFSEENAAKLYQRFRFIYQQVQTKADTRAAFLTSSPSA
jgi:hypothetical protein